MDTLLYLFCQGDVFMADFVATLMGSEMDLNFVVDVVELRMVVEGFCLEADTQEEGHSVTKVL